MSMIARIETAEAMVGKLASGMYYIYPVGGEYRESPCKVELIQYLIDNKIV